MDVPAELKELNATLVSIESVVDLDALRRESLGDLPARPSPPRVRVISRELRRGCTLEKVALDNGVDGEVTALFLLPARRDSCRSAAASKNTAKCSKESGLRIENGPRTDPRDLGSAAGRSLYQ